MAESEQNGGVCRHHACSRGVSSEHTALAMLQAQPQPLSCNAQTRQRGLLGGSSLHKLGREAGGAQQAAVRQACRTRLLTQRAECASRWRCQANWLTPLAPHQQSSEALLIRMPACCRKSSDRWQTPAEQGHVRVWRGQHCGRAAEVAHELPTEQPNPGQDSPQDCPARLLLALSSMVLTAPRCAQLRCRQRGGRRVASCTVHTVHGSPASLPAALSWGSSNPW